MCPSHQSSRITLDPSDQVPHTSPIYFYRCLVLCSGSKDAAQGERSQPGSQRKSRGPCGTWPSILLQITLTATRSPQEILYAIKAWGAAGGSKDPNCGVQGTCSSAISLLATTPASFNYVWRGSTREERSRESQVAENPGADLLGISCFLLACHPSHSVLKHHFVLNSLVIQESRQYITKVGRLSIFMGD
jgi:hypothetical protein